MSSLPETPDLPQSRVAVASAVAEGVRSGKLELPIIPRTARRVLELTQDPEADMAELSQLIHGDQTIASHVLRIANSAAFSSGEPIVSLQQAVTRLGMKLLGEIAIAAAVQSDIFRAEGFETCVKALLRHALASAAYGREIARKRRRNVEGQFLCGLLHSVGKPICLQLIAKAQQTLETRLTAEDVERVLSLLHPKIATKVAIDWKLPRQLQITTVYFERYPQAPSFRDEAAATYLSQRLGAYALDPSTHEARDIAQDPVVAFLNLYPDDFQELLDKRGEVTAAVAAMEL